MVNFNENDKIATLNTCKHIFLKQIELDKILKEELLDKIQEIKNMTSFVVDNGWLFKDMVEESILVLNNVNGIPELDCTNFSSFLKQAYICLIAYQGTMAQNAKREYFSLIDDLKNFATREQLITPLERYVRVCNHEILYLQNQVKKIDVITQKFSSLTNSNRSQNKE